LSWWQGGKPPDPQQQGVLQKAYESCVDKCIDKILPTLKAMEGRILNS
jgi:hypothetical protein